MGQETLPDSDKCYPKQNTLRHVEKFLFIPLTASQTCSEKLEHLSNMSYAFDVNLLWVWQETGYLYDIRCFFLADSGRCQGLQFMMGDDLNMFTQQMTTLTAQLLLFTKFPWMIIRQSLFPPWCFRLKCLNCYDLWRWSYKFYTNKEKIQLKFHVNKCVHISY